MSAAPSSSHPTPATAGSLPASHTVTDPHHMLPAHASGSGAGEGTSAAGTGGQKSGGSKTGGRIRMALVLLVLIAVTAFVVWRIQSNKKQEEQQAQKQAQAANRPTPVQTVAVAQQTVPVYLTALGTVTAYNTVTLHSRVDGQLLSVNFREGQAVRKGQLLIEIDPRPYQATLDQGLGTYAKDEASLKYAQAEAQRYTALYEAGVVSKESQQTQISTSGQAAGTLKADQATIEAARVNLGYTRIYSPIDGVVGLRQVDPGNIVHASDTTGLVVITQIHPIAIIFTLPEDQIPQVQKAMKAGGKLAVEAYDRSDSHKIASGTLLTIDNQIDTTTGTAKLKAVFDNADGGLFANEFVNIRLILRERPNAIVVPTAAIQTGTKGDYVYVVNHGPTPAGKRQNLPSNNLATPVSGSGAERKKKATDAATSSEGGGGSASDAGGGKHGGDEGKPKFHVDQVPVHVDMTIGTSTVLSDGAVTAGQQVVVDGAERLVDGGNVTPQAARTGGQKNAAASAETDATTGGTAGASGATGASGSAGGHHRHGGGQPQ